MFVEARGNLFNLNYIVAISRMDNISKPTVQITVLTGTTIKNIPLEFENVALRDEFYNTISRNLFDNELLINQDE